MSVFARARGSKYDPFITSVMKGSVSSSSVKTISRNTYVQYLWSYTHSFLSSIYHWWSVHFLSVLWSSFLVDIYIYLQVWFSPTWPCVQQIWMKWNKNFNVLSWRGFRLSGEEKKTDVVTDLQTEPTLIKCVVRLLGKTYLSVWLCVLLVNRGGWVMCFSFQPQSEIRYPISVRSALNYEACIM